MRTARYLGDHPRQAISYSLPAPSVSLALPPPPPSRRAKDIHRHTFCAGPPTHVFERLPLLGCLLLARAGGGGGLASLHRSSPAAPRAHLAAPASAPAPMGGGGSASCLARYMMKFCTLPPSDSCLHYTAALSCRQTGHRERARPRDAGPRRPSAASAYKFCLPLPCYCLKTIFRMAAVKVARPFLCFSNHWRVGPPVALLSSPSCRGCGMPSQRA